MTSLFLTLSDSSDNTMSLFATDQELKQLTDSEVPTSHIEEKTENNTTTVAMLAKNAN